MHGAYAILNFAWLYDLFLMDWTNGLLGAQPSPWVMGQARYFQMDTQVMQLGHVLYYVPGFVVCFYPVCSSLIVGGMDAYNIICSHS